MKEIDDFIEKNKQWKAINSSDGFAYYLDEDDIYGIIEIYSKKIDEMIISFGKDEGWIKRCDIIKKLEELK